MGKTPKTFEMFITHLNVCITNSNWKKMQDFFIGNFYFFFIIIITNFFATINKGQSSYLVTLSIKTAAAHRQHKTALSSTGLDWAYAFKQKRGPAFHTIIYSVAECSLNVSEYFYFWKFSKKQTKSQKITSCDQSNLYYH